MGPLMGEICCLDGQVYDNGICAANCPSERPMENGGICECESGKFDLGGGLCCVDGDFNNNGECANMCPAERPVEHSNGTCGCHHANLNGVCCLENQKMYNGDCVNSCQDNGKIDVEGLCGK